MIYTQFHQILIIIHLNHFCHFEFLKKVQKLELNLLNDLEYNISILVEGVKWNFIQKEVRVNVSMGEGGGQGGE